MRWFWRILERSTNTVYDKLTELMPPLPAFVVLIVVPPVVDGALFYFFFGHPIIAVAITALLFLAWGFYVLVLTGQQN